MDRPITVPPHDAGAFDPDEGAYDAFSEGSNASSLADDLKSSAADGRTYLQAELAFQKSRASFTADRAKVALIYGAGAFALLHLALIALAVGSVISLSGLVGPWLATGIVVAILVIGAVLLGLKLRRATAQIGSLFNGDHE